jgi:hypothetical protein
MPATNSKPTASKPSRKELEAENERLRAEVDRLDRILHPPPPEPEPEPEPKPRGYVLATETERRRMIAPNMREYAVKQMPDYEWQIAYRKEDVPVGELALDVGDLVAVGFGKAKMPRFLCRTKDGFTVLRTPEFTEAIETLFDLTKKLHDESAKHSGAAKRTTRDKRRRTSTSSAQRHSCG